MSAVVTDDLTAVDVMLSGPTDGGSASQVRRACPTTTAFPCLPHPHPSHFWACEPEPHRTLAYGPDVPRPNGVVVGSQTRLADAALWVSVEDPSSGSGLSLCEDPSAEAVAATGIALGKGSKVVIMDGPNGPLSLLRLYLGAWDGHACPCDVHACQHPSVGPQRYSASPASVAFLVVLPSLPLPLPTRMPRC